MAGGNGNDAQNQTKGGGAGGSGYVGQNGANGTLYGGGGGGDVGYGRGGQSGFVGNGGTGGGPGGGSGGLAGYSTYGGGSNSSINGQTGGNGTGNGGGGGGGAGGGGNLNGTYVGGTGGGGGSGAGLGGGGGGGAGGYGGISNAANVAIGFSTSKSAVGGNGGAGGKGGRGGNGGFGNVYYGYGGDGGAGFVDDATATDATLTIARGFSSSGGAAGAGKSSAIDSNGPHQGFGGAGVYVQNTAAGFLMTNNGTLTGGNVTGYGLGGSGVAFAGSGATLVNGASGIIEGGYRPGSASRQPGYGVQGQGLTVVNSGKIHGGGAGQYALDFTGGNNVLAFGRADAASNENGIGDILLQAGTLTFDQTAAANLGVASGLDVFLSVGITGHGAVIKAGTGTLTLELPSYYTGGTTITAGTLAVSNDDNLGAETGGLTFDGGTLETTATLSSARATTLSVDGTIQVDAGTTTTLSGVVNGGGALVKTGAGTLVLASTANTYGGGTTLDAGTLDLAAAQAAGGHAITFAAAAPATLALESAAQPGTGTAFADTLTGFSTGSVLDLRNFVVTSTTYANGTLTLTGNLNGATQTTIEQYRFASPSSTAFTTMSDNAGGTDVMVCFASGTRIRTLRGDVAVEDLRVGDLAVTAAGAPRPIKWLGRRKVDCRRHPRPHEAYPICIAAHAFGDDRPTRDLFVSPGHSICVDVVGAVLMPAGALVNGATIQQVEVDAVTYWHVELDSHDILLAENLACESYLDMGNRGFFDDADVVEEAAGPDAITAGRTTTDYCRPFNNTGPLVEVVRAQLRRRVRDTGWTATDALDLRLEVDQRRLDPIVRGLTARFHVPAGGKDVLLVSPTARPSDTIDGEATRAAVECLVSATLLSTPRARHSPRVARGRDR